MYSSAIIEKKYCCLCEHEVDLFLPYSISQKVFTKELEIIGSDGKNFYCPNCRCHDRARHLWLFLNKLELFQAINENFEILYFAPESVLFNKFLEKTNKITVADFNPDTYKEISSKTMKVDIENIPFSDSSFNIVIANHILEHIKDYNKAIREIKRVLKTDGYAILQTPYSPVIYENFEDPFINTNGLREKYYGQSDHVRIFGERLFDDFMDAGFTVYKLGHEEVLPEYDPVKYGVNVRENLIIVAND
jgi:SAM-dependent methyltransferase